MPVNFAVFHYDTPADARLDFADSADVVSTTRWQMPSLDDKVMHGRATDSREFALLAAKRWRHYRDTHCAALTLPDLQRMIIDEPQGSIVSISRSHQSGFAARWAARCSAAPGIITSRWIFFLFIHASRAVL